MSFPAGSTLNRLTLDYFFKHFDCGDEDLNSFLLEDSKSYLQKLLAVTYILETDSRIIAFFSMLNDKITITDVDSKGQWKRLFRNPTGKSFSSHPAVKIGRFGVSNEFKGLGIGSELIDYIKAYFLEKNKTGCRYITVDAYKASLQFYERNGFEYLTSKDQDSDTRLMYFDLITLTD